MTRSETTARMVLVVEPDEEVLARLAGVLEQWARVVAARSGREAHEHLARANFSLVLLMSPVQDMTALDLCRQILSSTTPPMVFIAGVDAEREVLASYDAGADGYIPKPYRLRELDARVRAVLRRAPSAIAHDGSAVTIGDVTLNPESHEVWVRGRAVKLPLREFQLLSVLMAEPGKIWNRGDLMRRLWAETPPSGTKSLDVHIGRLRARIEDDPTRPTRILTVRGVGYQYALVNVEDALVRR